LPTGELFFDDEAAITENDDVIASGPYAATMTDIWANDFWGMPMLNPKSHKSFRPLTVMTFRANHHVHGLSHFGYNVFNVACHALVRYVRVICRCCVLPAVR
jgi:hypothetical protein